MSNSQKLDQFRGHQNTRNQKRLTLDTWICWVKDGNIALAELFTPADFERTFSVVSQSEFLCNNLFQLPQLVQNRIGNYINAEYDFFPEYAASLDMLLRMNQMDQSHSKISTDSPYNWFAESTLTNTKEARKFITDSHHLTEFQKAEFIQHQCDLCPYFASNIFYLTDLVTNCLTVVHGTKHMSEVIALWETLTEYRNLLDLISVADNWENVKSYPIDWAIELSIASTLKPTGKQ